MPSASSLPSTLEPLTRRNATILLDELWRPSLAQLIEVLERIRDELATSVAGTAAPVVASSPLGDVPVQSIEGAGAAGRTPFDRTSRHETGDRATNESDATSARSSDLADGSIAHEHQAESPGRSSHPRGSADRPKRRPWKLIAVISSLAVVIAAGIAAFLLSRSDDKPRHSTSPAAAHLESLLPPRASTCTEKGAPPRGAARVGCRSTPEAGQTSVDLTFDLYPGRTSARQAFGETVPAEVVTTERVCPNGPDRSEYSDSHKKTVGLLACWIARERPYIAWTHDAAGVVALEAGQKGTPLKEAFDVWKDMPISPP